LPDAIKRKLQKQESLFRQNPHHPSLHSEKLEPKGRQIWSFRIDRRYRVLFRFEDRDTVVLLSVGSHEWIYRVAF
jgi:mRNA-degrading endonuclease RelE of RelBE toxin-antitoxin system